MEERSKYVKKNRGFDFRIKYLVTSGLTHMNSVGEAVMFRCNALGFGTEKSAEISAFYELVTADDR
jgi:hypothetical protein